MTSRLRVLGLRIALLCALVATVLATHVAVARPSVPFAVFDSLDRAFALVYEAAERKVAALEAAVPAPQRHDVLALLRELERVVTAEDSAATARLDVELVLAGALSPERRVAVLGCVERHLAEARSALRHASDPAVRAEYRTTCERLREIRRLV